MAVNTTLVSGHKIIVDPEGAGEVCGVLGTNHADVGWVCSRSTLINKWAKYKPVRMLNLLNTVPDLEKLSGNNYYTWKSTATWWKAYDNSCGLSVKADNMTRSIADNVKTPQQLLTDYDALVTWYTRPDQWEYEPPTGTNYPYRLIDFNCYDHNAVCFIKGLIEPTHDIWYAGDNADVDAPNCMTWQMTLPSGSEGDFSLGMGDVTLNGVKVEDLHFGLLFVNIGSNFSDFSNFEYRKFVIAASPMIKNGGTSISLSGRDTASLVNQDNTRSEQNYDVYPILMSSPITSMTIFGSSVTGSLIVMPNASPFRIELRPNELDGIIMGDLDSYEDLYDNYTFNNIQVSLLNTNASKTMKFTVISSNSSTSDVSLGFEIWRKNGSTYEYERTVYNPVFTQTGEITLQPRGSVTLNVRYPIPKSYFVEGAEYGYKVVGTVSYYKGSASSKSVSTLLALPPTNLAYIYVTKNFKIYASLKSKTATSYSVYVWVENLKNTNLDFSWSTMLEYDLTSYPKTAQGGTDYQDGLIQTGFSVNWSTETVPANSTSAMHEINNIEPRQYGHGYFATIALHARASASVDIGTAGVNVEYP